jgi:hypothetical protein
MNRFKYLVKKSTEKDYGKSRHTGLLVKKGKVKIINEVKILEQKPTLQLSVRFRELLAPLLFPVRRGSQDYDSDDDSDGFPGRKGWVLFS